MGLGIRFKRGNGDEKKWKVTAWECERMRMQKSIPSHLQLGTGLSNANIDKVK